MSADLLAAFGASDQAQSKIDDESSAYQWQQESQTPRNQGQNGHTLQIPQLSDQRGRPDNTSIVEDTWQPWPSRPQTTNPNTRHQQRPNFTASGQLWHRDEDGADVLFDADMGDADAFTSDSTPAVADIITSSSTRTNVNTANIGGRDEDDFGDFETADAVTTTSRITDSSNAKADPSHSTNLVDYDVKPSRTEEEDDWGDFEAFTDTAQAVAQPAVASATKSTTVSIAVRGSEAKQGQATPSKATSRTKMKPQQGQIGQESVLLPKSNLPEEEEGLDAWDTFESRPVQPMLRELANTNEKVEDVIDTQDGEDDDWDAFEDGVTPPTSRSGKPPISSPLVPALAPVPMTTTNATVTASPKITTSTPERERPNNIPPPAVLLQILPKLYDLLESEVKASIGSAKSPTSSSNSRTDIDIGTKLQRVFRVSARLISGRNLRWKRDSVLAQSMTISGAGRSGGGGRGMKLAALDKGESRKEEQEATEAIAAWSRRAHQFHAVLRAGKPTTTTTRAGTQAAAATRGGGGKGGGPGGSGSLTLNETNTNTHLAIRTATGPDALLDPGHKVCVLCGLKRNERVSGGVDVDVQDSFGEFWLDHWGHTDCAWFWYDPRIKGLMSQR